MGIAAADLYSIAGLIRRQAAASQSRSTAGICTAAHRLRQRVLLFLSAFFVSFFGAGLVGGCISVDFGARVILFVVFGRPSKKGRSPLALSRWLAVEPGLVVH